ncbi:MAG: GntR family transcriptional regulator [Victivallaceae bacterium]|nr:GntR family transcriptional regulator [Victivallaceae bacterium]
MQESKLTSILKMISRSNAVPLYVQIKEALKLAIMDEVFSGGECIPSEREFCQLLKVSHITVRQALNELTLEGFLSRIPGKGTFVPERRNSNGKSIGIVFPDTQDPISPYFFSGVLLGAKKIARQYGYRLIFFSDSDTDYLNVGPNDALQGVILIDPQMRDARFLILQEKKFPFVVLGNPSMPGIPFVDNDNVKIGYLMAAHLLERGYRKIALLNGPLHFTNTEDRSQGFRQALTEYGIVQPKPLIGHAAFQDQAGYAATQKILQNHPDALICADDLQAAGALRAIREAGLRLPDEIALVCANNSTFTRLTVPPITAVDIFPEEIGRQVAQKLISQITGDVSENRTIVSVSLIARDSSGISTVQGPPKCDACPPKEDGS